jgi:hypothetical protein
MTEGCIQIKRSGHSKGLPCNKKIKDFENQLCFEHSKRLKNNKARVTKPKKESIKKEKPKKEVENWGQEGVDWVYEEDIEDNQEGKQEENIPQQESMPPQTEETKVETLDFEDKIQIDSILEDETTLPPEEEKPKTKRKTKAVENKQEKPVAKKFCTKDLVELGFYVLMSSAEAIAVENDIHIEGSANDVQNSPEVKACLAEIAHQYEIDDIPVSPEMKLCFLVSTITYNNWLKNRILMKNKSLSFNALSNNGFKNPEAQV